MHHSATLDKDVTSWSAFREALLAAETMDVCGRAEQSWRHRPLAVTSRSCTVLLALGVPMVMSFGFMYFGLVASYLGARLFLVSGHVLTTIVCTIDMV